MIRNKEDKLNKVQSKKHSVKLKVRQLNNTNRMRKVEGAKGVKGRTSCWSLYSPG